MRLAASAGLALLVWLSGCGDSNSPYAGGEPGDAAHLFVLVISDEYLPVAGARVVVPGLGLESVTDDAGLAHIDVGLPGRYRVVASHAGFYSNSTAVVLAVGEESTARVALRDAPRDANLEDTILYYGTCTLAAYGPGGALGSGECQDVPGIPPGHLDFFLSRGFRGAEFEVRFDGQPAGLERMRLRVSIPDAGAFTDGRLALETTGTSPLRLSIPAALVTAPMGEPGHRLEVQLGAPQEGAVQAGALQPFFLLGDVFYFLPAPPVD